MASLKEIRKKYPQYSDLSDQELARGLHKRFYSDMPFEDFSQRIGLASAMTESPAKPSERRIVAGAVEGFPGVETTREGVRAGVDQLPSGAQFAVREGASIVGTAAGAAVGGLPGAMIGGGLGERFAQDIGFAPESTARQVMAAGAPAVGAGVVKGLQLGGRFAANMPMVRRALQQIDLEAMATQAGGIGAKVLSKGKGLMERSAAVLYRGMARFSPKFQVTPDDLPLTARALDKLAKRLEPHKSLEETGKILAAIDSIKNNVFNNPNVDLDVLMIHRKVLGSLIGKWEAAAGTKLGASKVLFRALVKDVEKLPFKLQGKLGPSESQALAGATRFFKAAPERAKLEFAVQDLETKVSQWMAGDMKASKLASWIRSTTNPKNADAFDRNFTKALEKHIPGVVKFFEEAAKLEAKPTFGPGSLRGAALFSTFGATVGGFAGGAVGAGAGAFGGLMLPEVITAILMKPAGRKLLTQMATASRGKMNPVLVGTLSQMFRAQVEELTGQQVQSIRELVGQSPTVGP